VAVRPAKPSRPDDVPIVVRPATPKHTPKMPPPSYNPNFKFNDLFEAGSKCEDACMVWLCEEVEKDPNALKDCARKCGVMCEEWPPPP
jgi:hypothetical protein